MKILRTIALTALLATTHSSFVHNAQADIPAIIAAPSSSNELMCPTYEEGQQHRSCVLTGLSNCAAAYPSCNDEAFVLTTNDIGATVQNLCCGKETLPERNKCFKKRRRELKKAKGLDALFRAKLKQIISGYLTSEIVCGEE